MIFRLAGSGDALTNALAWANDAWAENTALVNEAEKRCATTASQIQGLWSDVKMLGIEFGNVLLPMRRDMIAMRREFVQGLSEMEDGTKEAIVKIGPFTAALGVLISGLGSVIGTVGTINGVLGVLGGTAQVATPAIAGLAGVITALSGVVKTLIGLVAKINPIFAAVTVAVGVGIKAWGAYKKSQEEANRAMATAGENLADLRQRLEEVAESAAATDGLIRKWRELNAVIADGAEDTETLLKARDELAAVEEQLVQTSQGLITNHDPENGLLETKIPLLERLAELEREKLMLDLQLATAGMDEERIQQEIDGFQEK